MRANVEAKPRPSLFKVAVPGSTTGTRRRRRTRQKPPYVGLGILGVLVISSLVGPLVSPYGELAGALSDRLLAPLGGDSAGHVHLLGTDPFGRDVATRIAYGIRVSIIVGLVGSLLGATVGSALGLIAASFGKLVDVVVMRLADIALSIPGVLVAVLIATVMRPSLQTVFLVVGLLLWPGIARVVRAEALSLRESDYVKYARVAGCSRLTIARRHLLPNVGPTILVLVTLNVGAAILLEAAISFLGVGLPPDHATLGAMINAGRGYLDQWWLAVFPGLGIFLIVICVNMIGDWVRVRFDPRLKEA